MNVQWTFDGDVRFDLLPHLRTRFNQHMPAAIRVSPLLYRSLRCLIFVPEDWAGLRFRGALITEDSTLPERGVCFSCPEVSLAAV